MASRRVEEMASGRRGSGGRTRRRGLDAPDVGVGVAADVRKTRRPVSLGTRDDRASYPSSPTNGSRSGVPSPAIRNLQSAALAAEQNLGAVGRPPGIVRRQSRADVRRRGSPAAVTSLRERQQGELAGERRDLAAEGQPLAVRRDRWIGVGKDRVLRTSSAAASPPSPARQRTGHQVFPRRSNR